MSSYHFNQRDDIRAIISIFVVALVVFLPYLPGITTNLDPFIIELMNGAASSVIAVYFAVKRNFTGPSTFGLPHGVVRIILLAIVGAGLIVGGLGGTINWTFVGAAVVSIITWAYPQTE